MPCCGRIAVDEINNARRRTNRLLVFGPSGRSRRGLRASNGSIVNVEPQVFELIAFLVTHRGRLVSYDEIVENV
jgi:DNA-binding winged helix-turn-helix (wHTH) protein